MLERFYDLATKLQSTAARLEKEAMLASFCDDKDMRAVLHFLFNPYIVTGISDKKLYKKHKEATLFDLAAKPTETAGDLLGLIDYFRENGTGRDVDVNYLHAFASDKDPKYRDVIFGLIKKDLKLGVQEKTLNKVFGDGFIPTMNVMLAESWADNQEFLLDKEFIITEKFDGVRAVLIFDENKNPNFYSRGGRPILDLVELSVEAGKLDPEYVYDGELLLANPKPEWNAADIYRATVRITASDANKVGLNFNIFDRVLRSDFVAGRSEQPAIDRKEALKKEIEKLDVVFSRYAPILYRGFDVEVIPLLLEKHTQNGEEGLMINPSDSPYECKRTKNLLKVKQFHTADVLVESIEEGTGANKGRLGAVWVRFIGPDKKEYTCKVGSGFKQEERELYWANPDKIVGKIIEVQYFELSKNQKDSDYSLRFPTFKHVRADKNEISMH